jgi:hypothetical protein
MLLGSQESRNLRQPQTTKHRGENEKKHLKKGKGGRGKKGERYSFSFPISPFLLRFFCLLLLKKAQSIIHSIQRMNRILHPEYPIILLKQSALALSKIAVLSDY